MKLTFIGFGKVKAVGFAEVVCRLRHQIFSEALCPIWMIITIYVGFICRFFMISLKHFIPGSLLTILQIT